MMSRPAPVEISKRYKLVAEVLRSNIASGRLPPGVVLLEGPIASLMKTSRAPVQAALRILEDENLIHRFGGRGYLVGRAGSRVTPLRRHAATKPSPKWVKEQIVGQIWKDPGQTELWMVPTVYNYDSIGYRPDLVSKEEASTWTAIFDDKFKGKTGLNVDPLIAFGQAVLAMNSLKLLDVPN